MEIGDHVQIKKGGWLMAKKMDEHIPQLVIRGPARIGYHATISAVRDVYIGSNINIAERVFITDSSHQYENITTPIWKQPIMFIGSTHIGDDTWIGINVSILGAKVGRHCVIGANSVVIKDIPDYCVAAGSPAKVIKRYNFQTSKWERVDKNGEFSNE